MVTKKDLFIVALATFCLTATLFLTIPTKSSPSGYDPWLDANDDGKINILDFSAVAKAWQATGDPTKNVNVINWPSPKLQYETIWLGTFNITSGKYWWFSIPRDPSNPVFCGGYSKLSIMYQPGTFSHVGDFTLYLSGIEWYTEAYSHSVPHTIETCEYVHLSNTTFFQGQQPSVGWYAIPEPALVDAKAPYFALVFTTETDSPNWINMWVEINVWVYLRNE